jgi:hypothetical protein
MSRRSRVPNEPSLSREMFTFLDRLDNRRLSAISDLAGGASTADIVTAFNALLAEMRARDAMEQ